MGKVRSCNDRCHSAKHARCLCWCGGAFHGSGGVVNRQTLADAVSEEVRLQILEQHGFVHGESVYKNQMRMAILKPGPGKCPACAAEHNPDEPHDPTSLYYQSVFKSVNNRLPTWKDAMGHCTPEVQAAWAKELAKYGIKT
jgi:hypothetical protein